MSTISDDAAELRVILDLRGRADGDATSRSYLGWTNKMGGDDEVTMSALGDLSIYGTYM